MSPFVISRSDYQKVDRLVPLVGFTKNSIRSFVKLRGIRPKFFLSVEMYSLSEIMEHLTDEPVKVPRTRKAK
jgi:hypothetical protein